LSIVICAVVDPTQEGKVWDDSYFNSGMFVMHPSDDDFLKLFDAFENNTLTNQVLYN
jgi:hypothetical protein